jgi:hypothetical protein
MMSGTEHARLGVEGPTHLGSRSGGDGALAAAVDMLAAEALSHCSGDARAAVAAVRDRLAEPLRVAVLGRVSSGKSTLVNALLESRVAPTAAGECTLVPCWFRHGSWQTATLRTRDGGSVTLPLAEGRLPQQLPVAVEQVDRIDVTLPVPLLRSLTLVDTPGLASAATAAGHPAVAAESTISAAGAADAVLLVVNGPLKQDEAEAVAAFRARSVRDPLAAGTALAVVTKADQMAERTRTMQVAADVSADMAREHRTMLAAVVPVVGLLGETASAGLLDENDARALAGLATEWDRETTEFALSDHRLFADVDGPVSPDHRRRLLELLGLFGAGELIARATGSNRVDATALTDWAHALSGVAQLRDLLLISVARRADVLKASTALHALSQAATMPGTTSWLGDRVQALSDSEVFFPVRVLTAAAWVASGRVCPPATLAAQVAAAAVGPLPGTDRAAAAEHAAAWRSWRMFADGPGQHTADVMVRAWQLAASRGPR